MSARYIPLIENELANKKIISKIDKNDPEKDKATDMVSMVGGCYKVNNQFKLLKFLATKATKGEFNCALTPKMKHIENFLYYIDLDFKDLTTFNDVDNLMKFCQMTVMTIREVYTISDEDILLSIFKRGNNFHIYSNMMVSKIGAVIITERIIKKYIAAFGENKNSTGGAIFDTLNGYKTGIRLECFDKAKRNENGPYFEENTHYSYYGVYEEDEEKIDMDEIPILQQLQASNYYKPTEGSYIEGVIIEAVVIEYKKNQEKEIKDEIEIDVGHLNDTVIKDISNFFKTVVPYSFWTYENTLALQLALLSYTKKKGHNKTSTKTFFDNFFGNIIPLNTVDKTSGLTYKEKNDKMIESFFKSNPEKPMTFGSIHYILKTKISEEIADKFKVLMPTRDMEEELQEIFDEYAKENNFNDCEKENVSLDFICHLLEQEEQRYIDLACIYFQKHFVFIAQDDCFYNVRRHYEEDRRGNLIKSLVLETYKESGLSKLNCGMEGKTKTLIQELKEKRFKQFGRLVFNPTEKVSKNDYNIFEGFGFQKTESIELKEHHKENFKAFLDYIKVFVCDNNEATFQYFMAFLANIIQEPGFKPHICPIFFSQEKGTGKSSFAKLLKAILGDIYTFIGNVRDVVEKHSTAAQFKFLNVIEELDTHLGNDNYEILKDKIQNEESVINEKFKNMKTVKDYVRYIITTNTPGALPLDRDNRRFFLLKFKKAPKETIQLLDEIYERERNVYAKMLGEYLMDFEIPFKLRKDWEDNRPYHPDIALFYKVSSVDEFMMYIYNNEIENLQYELNDDVLIIESKRLHKIYKDNMKYSKSLVKFNAEMETGFDFIDKIKKYSKGSVKLSIDLQGLYNYLSKYKLINEDNFINNYSFEE